jgi:hypothetical protein
VLLVEQVHEAITVPVLRHQGQHSYMAGNIFLGGPHDHSLLEALPPRRGVNYQGDVFFFAAGQYAGAMYGLVYEKNVFG